MLENIYVANSALVVQERIIDIRSNNLANMQSPGFKRDEPTVKPFAETLQLRLDGLPAKPRRYPIGYTTYGVMTDAPVTVVQDGPLQETGRSLDLALVGEGFFVVDSPQGHLYTRSGNLRINAGGYLVAENGYLVLGDSGPLPVGGEDVVVSEDGSIRREGELIGRLLLVDLRPGTIPQKVGRDFFQADADTEVSLPRETRVLAGYLEAANVNFVFEMVKLLEAQRAYNYNARVLQVLDGLAGRAADEVGRLR